MNKDIMDDVIRTKEVIPKPQFKKDFSKILNTAAKYNKNTSQKIAKSFEKAIKLLETLPPSSNYIGYREYKNKEPRAFYRVNLYNNNVFAMIVSVTKDYCVHLVRIYKSRMDVDRRLTNSGVIIDRKNTKKYKYCGFNLRRIDLAMLYERRRRRIMRERYLERLERFMRLRKRYGA